MGRKKKKKRRHFLIQYKRDPLLQQSNNRGDQELDDYQSQALPKTGEPLNAKTILQLQRTVGNRRVRELVSQQAIKTGVVQREGSKDRGYRRDKPPQPWEQFARPQAPHRDRRRGRRKTPLPPQQETPVQQPARQTAAPSIIAPKGSSLVMSGDEFKEKSRLKILGFKYIIHKKIRRPGRSGKYFADWITRLRHYHARMQGADLDEKANFLRKFVDDLGSWLADRTTGKKSSRRSPVEKLISQLVNEIDRLYMAQAKHGWQEYQSSNIERPKEKAAFLQELLYQIRGRATYDQEKYSYYFDFKDNSKMKSEAEKIEDQIDDEVDNQLLGASPTKDWFNKQEERFFKDEAQGGQLNKLDLIKYRFKLGKRNGRFTKTPAPALDPSALRGYYKKKIYEDTQWEFHKGRKHDMPVRSPGHHRRTVAMYKLDKILGSDVIPPTFLAKHHGVVGTFMEKAIGVKSTSPTESSTKTHYDSVGKLYLLDVIAGQVDRHHGNYLIEMKGGVVQGVKGFDLDLAFGMGYTGKKLINWEKDFKAKDDPSKFTEEEKTKQRAETKSEIRNQVAGKLPFELTELNQKTARRVVQLSNNGQQIIRDAMKGFINEAEIEATVDRLKVLAKMLKPIIKHSEGTVVSKK